MLVNVAYYPHLLSCKLGKSLNHGNGRFCEKSTQLVDCKERIDLVVLKFMFVLGIYRDSIFCSGLIG